MKPCNLRQIIVLVFCVSLFGCSDSEDSVELPKGEQLLSAYLKSAELSLVRRGTHVLEVNGADRYFAESSQVNLSRYENKELELRGTFEHNVSDEYLPLFNVTEVVNVLEEEVKSWSIHSLGVSLDLPETWTGTIEVGRAAFIAAGKEEPILVIDSQVFTEDEEPTGVPVVVGNNRAVRQSNEDTGSQVIYVDNGDEYIVFSFDPSGYDNPEKLRLAWLSALNSVTIKKAVTIGELDTGTGARPGLGMPCGGTAGILCPAGFYCDITNIEENIGICQNI